MATAFFRFDTWVRSSVGPSVPGAQIFVLSEPANLPSPLTQAIPTPTPLLPIFADVNGLVPITQPMITDGFGHVGFYLATSQAFTLAVYLNGALQNFYPDQFPMGAGAAGSVPGTGNSPLYTNGLANITAAPAGQILVTDGSGNASASSINTSQLVLPSNPQIGDGLQYNVYGDGKWDAVNAVIPSISMYINQATAAPVSADQVFGTGTAHWSSFGATGVNPTVSLQGGALYSNTASASANTNMGATVGQNGSNSLIGMLAVNRFSARLAVKTLANSRVWTGLGCWNSGSSLGNNSVSFGSGTASYASDTPNKTTIGFRYSSGTDVNFKGVVITANNSGGAQTVLDTGVVADTNTHLFEWSPNAVGTQINFFIDSVFVGSITTNIPSPSLNTDSWGTLFWTGDNKNTATANQVAWWSLRCSLRY